VIPGSTKENDLKKTKHCNTIKQLGKTRRKYSARARKNECENQKKLCRTKLKY